MIKPARREYAKIALRKVNLLRRRGAAYSDSLRKHYSSSNCRIVAICSRFRQIVFSQPRSILNGLQTKTGFNLFSTAESAQKLNFKPNWTLRGLLALPKPPKLLEPTVKVALPRLPKE